MLINSETINNSSAKDLRVMAKELGVKYASKMSKATLQEELHAAWEDRQARLIELDQQAAQRELGKGFRSSDEINAQCDVCGETEHTTADHDLADNEEVETLIEEMEEADGPDMLVDDASDKQGVTADYLGIPRRNCPSCKREGTIRPHIKGDYCQWADCGYVADRTDDASDEAYEALGLEIPEPSEGEILAGVVDEDALAENFSPEEQLVIRVAQHLGLTLAADFEFPGKGKAIKTTEGATIYLNSRKSAEVKALNTAQAANWEADALGTITKGKYLKVDVTSF